MSLTLRTVQETNALRAYENLLFLNPADLQQIARNPTASKECVLLNDRFPYIAQSDVKTEPGCVTVSRFQRESCSLDLDASVSLRRVSPSSSVEIRNLEIEAEDKKTFPVKRELDAKRAKDLVLHYFGGQPLIPGQRLVIPYSDGPITLLVLECGGGDQSGPFDPQERSGQAPRGGVGLLCKIREKVKIGFKASKKANLTILSEGEKMNTDVFKKGFTDFGTMGIGGLDAELHKIFTKAFSSRVMPPKLRKEMGIKHIRGMMLYGPPGTGKTTIARAIGKALNSRDPVVKSGPEMLNKYVGEGERQVRELFAAAEEEQGEEGENSQLHIIIIDEIDAICKERGSNPGGGGSSDSIVNQLLSKIDGVNALDNILLIGMTNRLDMIDRALRRPGRLELEMEIGLPDENGRVDILKIHTERMRKV